MTTLFCDETEAKTEKLTMSAHGSAAEGPQSEVSNTAPLSRSLTTLMIATELQ